MDVRNDQFLWVEKYRPQTIDDCILPTLVKGQAKGLIAQGQIQNLLFCGSAGTGKTTLAWAIAKELGADILYKNASSENGIDVLRTSIQQFASTVSLYGNKKIVILDEFDNASPDFQKALRAFIEQYAKNCRFIITANFKNRIIDPIHSRCAVIDFKIDNKEKPVLAAEFFKRVLEILTLESIQFDKKAVAAFVEKHFPDFRRTLNELQRYSIEKGSIDSGVLIHLSAESFKDLVNHLKQKEFNEVRKWVAANSDLETSELYRVLYDNAVTFVEQKCVPMFILILAKYQYQAAFVADHELNNMACLTEIMMECEIK